MASFGVILIIAGTIIIKELASVMQKCLEAIDDPVKRLVLELRVKMNMKLDAISRKIGKWSREKVRYKQKEAEQEMKICLKKHGWTLE